MRLESRDLTTYLEMVIHVVGVPVLQVDGLFLSMGSLISSHSQVDLGGAHGGESELECVGRRMYLSGTEGSEGLVVCWLLLKQWSVDGNITHLDT